MIIPISFKDFIRDPIKVLLILAISAMTYLYVDNRMVYQDQIEKQEKRIEVLENQVKYLQDKLLETIEKL